jgi:predicted alpha/beta-fold hydrolase
MPIIESRFNPPSLLRPAWVQTIAPTLIRRAPQGNGSHETLELDDGDFLELEWHNPKRPRSSPSLVILTHGLEGSTTSSYMLGLISTLTAQGYHVLAWNMRGCGTQRNRLLPWYHSGQTADLGAVITHAIARFPALAISLVGISIGGNIVCKYLGEMGDAISSTIRSAVAVSPPLDLRSSAEVLARPSRALYMRYLLTPLRERMREKAKRFPNQVTISDLATIRSFREFDERYTAPLHGFSSVDHYWDTCSGLQFLRHVTVPLYVVSALDDPFLSPSCFPTEIAHNSAFIHLETPRYGGHVGFIESASMRRTWLERRVTEYLSHSSQAYDSRNPDLQF